MTGKTCAPGNLCREDIAGEEQFSPTAVFGTKEEILDRFYDLLAEKIKQFPPDIIEILETNEQDGIFHNGQIRRYTMPRGFLRQVAEKEIRPIGITIAVFTRMFTNSITLKSLGTAKFDESVPEKSRAYWTKQFSGAINRHGDNPGNTGPIVSLEFILALHAMEELLDWLNAK